MESSTEASTEIRTCRRRRPTLQLNCRLFEQSINQVKKDSEKRTVTINYNVLSDKLDGKDSVPLHSVKSPLDEKSVTDEVKTMSSSKIHQNSKILSRKSYQKHTYESEEYCSNYQKELISIPKTESYNAKNNFEKKHFDSHSKSSGAMNSQDEESGDCIEFKEIKHNREILNLGDKNLKITLKTDVHKPISVTSSSKSLPVPNMHNLQTDSRSIGFDKKQIFLSSEDNKKQIFLPSEDDYIPPPVSRRDEGRFESRKDEAACNIQGSSSIVSENNRSYALSNDNVETAENLSNSGDETYFPLPSSEHIEAISNFILDVVKEMSVSNSVADQVERDINAVFRDHLDGQRTDVYGSYSSDLAISTSDINLALISDCSIRKSFMYEIYKLLTSELKRYSVYPYEDGNSPHQIKINFSHAGTGIKCQLAYLGKYRENVCKMGRCLREVSVCDARVKTLIVATKIWSEFLCINEVDDGKLHPVGYALMVLHFLQHCEKPILPKFPFKKTDIELLPPNNSSIGELWLAFLKYYAVTFNWKRDVITVKSGEYVSKKSKDMENYWIAVEDPFTGENIAKSVVNSDVADFIKACFKSSYEYFCSSPDHTVLHSDNEENESNGDSPSSKWQFSFQKCLAEQSDIYCEDCDELMDICDGCQKKLYVKPMVSLPKMTDSFLELVKDSLITVYKKYVLSDDEVNERKKFVETLQARVHSIYPDAELNLFGSSANGFGFKNSDLDICMTFKSDKVINTASVLKDLRFLLRKDKKFDHVIAIFSASIPIVKFHYGPKGWRGDISLRNILAIHNSSLLYTYSLLDERCKILGCALKLLAKKALVAEVTEKALSSYSYLNMVIHFLQQTDPPVLPVLQDSKFRKSVDYKMDYIVEKCNVWFCKDLNYIKSIFKAENETPVEQLWLDLLDFYCSYDTNRFISIRQTEPVYSCENKRSARLFNIQDPFIETKNLGCVVSDRKAHETRSVLARARQLFRTPVKELPTYIKDIEDFFFSTQSLTGRIHKEAHCDLCGKFGHETKDCKQSQFPIRRFNFRTFPRRNMYKIRNVKQIPMNRGPYRRLPMNQ